MLDAREKRTQAVIEAVKEARDNLLADFRLQVTERDRLANSLNAELAEIRQTNDALSAEIEQASLIKPGLISCDATTGEKVEPPNPFSDNFTDLWNSAGRVRDD